MENFKFLIRRLCIVVALLVASLIILRSNEASAAAAYYLPDPNDFSTAGNVGLEISQTGSEISLDAPVTWIKFVYDPAVSGPDVGVQVGFGYFADCGANAFDSVGAGNAGCNSGDPDYDPRAVIYRVYYGDPATGGSTPDLSFVAASRVSDTLNPANWTTIHQDRPSARPPIDIGGGKMRYVLYLKAEWNTRGPAVGRINAFKGAVIYGGGLASYWTGNGSYAIQDRLSPPGTQGTFNFGFAPPCNAPASQTATISWSDADAAGLGGVPPDANISFDLFEGDPGTVPGSLIVHVDEGSSPNIGGNNQNRSYSFTARKNKIYLWRWNDVERINGLQLSIPFDSFNYYEECNGTVQGRVFYDENMNGAYDAGEKLIKNPGATPCGGITANAVIEVSGVGTARPELCNPDPHYAISVPPGPRTLSLQPIPGWIITTPPKPINIVPGTVENHWFGMIIAPPSVVTKCVNTVSQADISWGPAAISSGGFFVDIDDSPGDFAGQYWNKGTGSSTATQAPTGFSPYPGPGPALDFNANPGTYTVRVYYSLPDVHTAPATFVTKGCPKLACGGLTTSPADPEDGDPFTFIVSFRNIGTGQLDSMPAKLAVNFPGYYTNIDTSYSARPLPAGGTASSTPISITAAAGVYTVSWNVTGDPQANQLVDPFTPGTCRQQVSVSKKPYLRVFGGDVMAGGVTSCGNWLPSSGTSGSILAFSKSDGSAALSGKGAGTQLLAQALSAINGFSSAQHRAAAASPLPDKGLTFANTGASLFGGAFGLGNCPPDYWGNPTAITGIPPITLPMDFTLSGSYLSSGLLVITPLIGGGTVANGKKIIYYVDGDVHIKQNITYQTVPGWSSPDDIPSFTLIARGNIYIDPGVTQLDGTYIAQPRPGNSGGTLYTCQFLPPSYVDVATDCINPLTITGAVVARTVKLQRSSGTVREANPRDCPRTLPGSAIYACNSSSTAAEQFIYTPEVWIRSNLLRRPSRPSTYDAVSNLPPVL